LEESLALEVNRLKNSARSALDGSSKMAESFCEQRLFGCGILVLQAAALWKQSDRGDRLDVVGLRLALHL